MMSESGPNNNLPQKRQGLISSSFSLLGKIIALLFTSLFLSLLIEWIGIAIFWPELGAEHSRQMMRAELQWFSHDFTRSLLISEPLQQAEFLLERSYYWLYVKTGIAGWISNIKTSDNQNLSYALYYYFDAYIYATLYITMTFILRLTLLVLTMPLFGLSVLVGLVDGLVRRDIRRFGSGYESGFIYHHAKRTIGPIFVTAWLLYLALPFSVHPNIILLPAALALGLAVSITTGAFKKYL
ncbi:TIGR03747 family integrating conjugative element membrane protein [Yersinia enterocolitica]